MMVSPGDMILFPFPIITLPLFSIAVISRLLGNLAANSERGIPTNSQFSDTCNSITFTFLSAKEDMEMTCPSCIIADILFAIFILSETEYFMSWTFNTGI